MTFDPSSPRTRSLASPAELNRLQYLADAIPECLWVIDLATGKIRYVSAAYEIIWGRRIKDLLDDQSDWLKHIHPDDQSRMKSAYSKMRSDSMDEEFRIVHPDGRTHWVQLTTFPIRDTNGNIESIGGITKDISLLIEQKRLAKTQIRILNALPAHIAILDNNGMIVEINDHWKQFTMEHGITNLNVGDNYLVAGETALPANSEKGLDIQNLLQGIRAILSGGDNAVTYTYPFGTSNQEYWFRVDVVPLHIGGTHGAAIMRTDITDRINAEQRMSYVAHYDALTALPNRLLFRDRLASALAMARHNKWVLATCIIDIDSFKSINDSLGHQIGDCLLKDIADRLQKSLRDGDTLSRLGGDEFALILTELKDQQHAALTVQQIIQVFSAPFSVDGRDTIITASIGISLFPDDADDIDLLIRNADTAMYRAKKSGRNGYQFFTSEMNTQVLNTLNMERDLRQALKKEEFLLHYQPKVSCRDGNITCLEALLRWKHPQRGLISPAEFIPLLEDTGLIIPVGDWVLRAACAQTRAWHDAGLGKPSIAVNVSGKQLYGNDICASVQQALLHSRLEPRYLEIELTESHLMHDADNIIVVLNHLKDIGVTISVDDFGTGYSSLAYLKRFPLDVLKIDRAFVQDITADPNDVSITRAIINLAHSFNLDVIAEGVETESQLKLLLNNQCDAIQGYFFSRPLPTDEATRMLSEKRTLPDSILKKTVSYQRTLLIVDHDEQTRQSLERTLCEDGYTILMADCAMDGFDKLAGHPANVVIANHHLPDMTGIEFMRRAQAIHPHTVRLMLFDRADLYMITHALNEGTVNQFIQKPWKDDALCNSVREAFRNHDLAHDNRHLQHEIQAANQALEQLNTQLWHLIDEKEQQMQRSETSLAVTQEILQSIPYPIVGIDDDNLIAFTNQTADALWGKQTTLIACEATSVLPTEILNRLQKDTPFHDQNPILIDGKPHRLYMKKMGRQSTSKGILFILLPPGTPA